MWVPGHVGIIGNNDFADQSTGSTNNTVFSGPPYCPHIRTLSAYSDAPSVNYAGKHNGLAFPLATLPSPQIHLSNNIPDTKLGF